MLRATTACNFSSLIWLDGSASAALASLLFDPPETQNPDRPIVWIKGFKPVVQTIVLNFFFNEYRSIFLLDLYFFSFHPPSGLFLFCKIRFKDYICFKNIFWIFFDF